MNNFCFIYLIYIRKVQCPYTLIMYVIFCIIKISNRMSNLLFYLEHPPAGEGAGLSGRDVCCSAHEERHHSTTR